MELEIRYITTEFLRKYFPDPDRFQKIVRNQPLAELEASKLRYLEFKSKINKERTTNGHEELSDRDLFHIINSAEGLLELPRPR